ncbi:hypothetical protein AHEV_209 [Adoxophyes honmai entomopoxvirus 'L']|uniref:Uncharacterized protein n=1 Tax=Adoxophyes honmai entomopoxvirus 'L' TaxID=1293540 RepID=A0A916P6B8_9POXV|nr:hypothetical protein AHEV_209 [Adoxophyes honmai entomopoxvirus 'L']CCU55530.1 hypothetical protein AHEV_209 [Adoxophyes honmai entomopoxvirus 'L']
MICGVSLYKNIHKNCCRNNKSNIFQDENIKQCPSCTIYIYKIEGCDIMWCTMCKVLFNWSTLKIVREKHNPHYVDYLFNNINKNNDLNLECELILYDSIPILLYDKINDYLNKNIIINNYDIFNHTYNKKICYIYSNKNKARINVNIYIQYSINNLIYKLKNSSSTTTYNEYNKNRDYYINKYINNEMNETKYKYSVLSSIHIKEFDLKARKIALECYNDFVVLLNKLMLNYDSYNDILTLYFKYFEEINKLMINYSIDKTDFMFNHTLEFSNKNYINTVTLLDNTISHNKFYKIINYKIKI